MQSVSGGGRLVREPGSHLLAEKAETVGMAEVLPGVEHLRARREELGSCQAVSWPADLCPPRKPILKSGLRGRGCAGVSGEDLILPITALPAPKG